MPLRRAVPRVMQARGPNDGERCVWGGVALGYPAPRHGEDMARGQIPACLLFPWQIGPGVSCFYSFSLVSLICFPIRLCSSFSRTGRL